MGVGLNSLPRCGYVRSLQVEDRLRTLRRAEGYPLVSRRFPESLLKAFRFTRSRWISPSHSRSASPARAGTRSRDRRTSHAVPLVAIHSTSASLVGGGLDGSGSGAGADRK